MLCISDPCHVLLSSIISIHLKLELLTQFSALNDEKCFHLRKVGDFQIIQSGNHLLFVTTIYFVILFTNFSARIDFRRHNLTSIDVGL